MSYQDPFKYGICQNSYITETGKACPKCLDKEVQKIRRTKDFVCSECGGKLKEIPRPKTPWEKYRAAIIGVLILLLGGSGAAFVLLDNQEKAKATIALDKKELVMKLGEKVQLNVTAQVTEKNGALVFKKKTDCVKVSDQGLVEAIKEGNDAILVTYEKRPNIFAICKVQVLPKEEVDTTKIGEKKDTTADKSKVELAEGQEVNTAKKNKTNTTSINPTLKGRSHGKIKLGWGTYSGELVNGKPNGYGTVNIHQHRLLDRTKEIYAEPGDQLECEFRDGVLAGGYGYLIHNGNKIRVRL